MGVLLFYYFVYLKVNLNQEKAKNKSLGKFSPNFIFVAMSLDPIVLEKRWTDSECWPNNFFEKVNRGEDWIIYVQDALWPVH